MWGRLTSVAQAVTDKLEESFGDDHEFSSTENVGLASEQPQQSQEEVLSDLRRALVESEKRNEDINHEFQRLLRAKEEEITHLKEKQSTTIQETGSSGQEVQNTLDVLKDQLQQKENELQMSEQRFNKLKSNAKTKITRLEEELAALRITSTSQPATDKSPTSERSVERNTLIAEKDNIIQTLSQQLQISQKREKDLEIEGRQNEEKCMADIAAKIMEIQQLKVKEEEVRQLLDDRNKTMQELMDKMEAQKRLIASRDEVIEHLQSMKDIHGGSDEIVSVLREQAGAMSNKIEQLVEECERHKKQTKTLQKEIDSQNEAVAAAEKMKHDNQGLQQQLDQQEADHQQTVRMLQDQIQLKEKKLAAELAEIEKSYKESEHMLKEQLDEKTSIIQAKDEAVCVLKMALQEKNFSGDTSIKAVSPETEKLVNLLEDRIKEKEQIISRLEVELQTQNGHVQQLTSYMNQLQQEMDGLKDDWGIRENELKDKVASLENKVLDVKKMHESEVREKDQLMKDKDSSLRESNEAVCKLREEIEKKDSKNKESSNERLLLLDTEKERQFLDEKRVFQDSIKDLQAELERVSSERNELKRAIELPAKELQEELNRLTEERSKLAKDLEKAQHDVEIRNKEAKDATAKMLKAKGQMKSKINNLEKQNEKLNKELETIRKKKPSAAENSKLREQIAELEEEKGNLQLRLVESEDTKVSLEAREKSIKELEERCILLEEENKSLTLKVVDVEEEKGHIQLQNVEYEDKFSKDEKHFTEVQNERLEQLTSELSEVKKAFSKVEEDLREQVTVNEELDKTINECKAQQVSFEKERTFFDQTYKELVDNIDSLKANLAEVEGYLLREREEKVSLQIKMAQIDEEKETLEEKRKELQQALDEFYWTTDKGKESAAVDEGPQDEEVQEEMAASVGTIVGASMEGSTFTDIIKLQEDEKYGLERRIDILVKERKNLQSKIEELEEMLEAEREKQSKKNEEISSDEDAEHARQALEETLNSTIEELHEENEQHRSRLQATVQAKAEIEKALKDTENLHQQKLEENKDLQETVNELSQGKLKSEQENRDLQRKIEELENAKSLMVQEFNAVKEGSASREDCNTKLFEQLKVQLDDAQEKHNKVRKENEELQKKIKYVIAANESMLSELQSLIDAKDQESNERMKKLDEQLEEREQHTQYLENKIAQLQQNLHLFRTTLQHKEELMNQVNVELESKEKSIDELLKNLEKKNDELLSYSDQVASKEGEFVEIQHLLGLRDATISSLKGKLEDQTAQLERSQSVAEKQRSRADSMDERIEQLGKASSSAIKDRDSEITSLKVRLEVMEKERLQEAIHLQASVQEKEVSQRTLLEDKKDLELRISELSAAKDDLVKTYTSCKNQLDDYGRENEKLKTRICDLEIRFEESANELEAATSTVSILKGQIEHLHNKNGGLQSQITEMSSGKEAMANELTSATSLIADLKEQNEELPQIIKSLRKKLEEREGEIEVMKNELRNTNSSLVEIKELNDDLMQENGDLRNGKEEIENEELSSLRCLLSQSKDENKDLLQRISQLISSNEELLSSLNSTVKDNDELKQQIDDLKQSLSDTTLTKDDLVLTVQKRLEDSIAENKDLVEKLEASDILVAELNQSNAKNKNIHAQNMNSVLEQLSEVEREIARLNETCSVKDKDLEQSRTIISNKNEEIEELMVMKENIVRELSSLIEEKETKLHNLEKRSAESSHEYQQKINERNKEISDLSAKREELLQDLETKGIKITELEHYFSLTIASREADIVALNGKIGEINLELDKKNERVLEMEKIIEEAVQKSKDEVEKKNNRIKELSEKGKKISKAVKKKEETIYDLENQIQELKQELEVSKKELKKSQSEMCLIEETLVAKEASFSLAEKYLMQIKRETHEKEKESLQTEEEKLSLQLKLREMASDLEKANENVVRLEGALQEEKDQAETMSLKTIGIDSLHQQLREKDALHQVELSHKEAQVSKLQDIANEKEGEMRKLRKELEISVVKISELNCSINDKSRVEAHLEEKTIELENEIAELQEQVKVNFSNNESQNLKLLQLTKENSDLKEEISSRISFLESLSIKFNEVQTNLTEKESIISALNDNISMLTEDKDKRIKELEDELSISLDKIKKFKIELKKAKSLKEQLTSSKEKIEQLENSISKKEGAEDILKSKEEEVLLMQERFEIHTEQISTLKEELKKVSSRAQDLERQLDESTVNHNELLEEKESEIKTLKISLHEISSNLGNLEASLQEANCKADEVKAELEEHQSKLSTEVKTWKKRAQNLKKAHETNIKEIQDRNKLVDSLKQELHDNMILVDSLKANIKVALEEKDVLIETCNTLSQELEKIKDETQIDRKTIESLKEELQNQELDSKQLDGIKESFRKQAKELQEYHEAYGDLSEERNKLLSSLEYSELSKINAQTEAESLRNDINNLNTEKVGLSEELNALRIKIESVQSSYAEVVDELQTSKDCLNLCSGENVRLKDLLDSALKRMDEAESNKDEAIKSALQKSEAERSELIEHLKQLELQKSTFEEINIDLESNLNRANIEIDQLKIEIEDHRKFPADAVERENKRACELLQDLDTAREKCDLYIKQKDEIEQRFKEALDKEILLRSNLQKELDSYKRKLEGVHEEKAVSASTFKAVYEEERALKNSLENDYSEVKFVAEAAIEKIDELSSELNKSTKEERDLQSELDSLRNKYDTLQGDVQASLQEELDKRIVEVKKGIATEFNQKLQDLKSHKDEVISKLKDKIREKVEMNRKSNTDYKLKIEGIQKDNEALLTKINCEIEEERNLRNDLNDEVKRLNIEVVQLREIEVMKKDLEENISVTKEELSALKSEYQAVVQENEEMYLKMQQALHAAENLTLDLERIKTEKIELDVRLQHSTSTEDVQKTLADKDKFIQQLKKKLKEERTEKEKMKRDMKEDKNAIDEKHNEINKLKEDFEVKINEINNQYQQEISSLTKQFKDNISKNADTESLRADQQSVNMQLIRKQNEIEELKRQLLEAETNLEYHQNDRVTSITVDPLTTTAFQPDLIELNDVIDKLKMDNEELKHRLETADKTEGTLSTNREEVKLQLEMVIQEKFDLEERLRKEATKFESSFMDISAKCAELEAQLERAHLERTLSQDVSDAIKTDSEEASDRNVISAELEKTKKNLEKMKTKLKNHIHQNREEKEKLNKEIVKLTNEKKQTCEDLRKEFQAIILEKDKALSFMKEEMEAMLDNKNSTLETDIMRDLRKEFRDTLKEKEDALAFVKEELEAIREEKESTEDQLNACIRSLKQDVNEQAISQFASSTRDCGQCAHLQIELEKCNTDRKEIEKSLQYEFEHICQGLREDLQNALKEKEAIEHTMETMCLELEQKLVQKEKNYDELRKAIQDRDNMDNSWKDEMITTTEHLCKRAESLYEEKDSSENLNKKLKVSVREANTEIEKLKEALKNNEKLLDNVKEDNIALVAEKAHICKQLRDDFEMAFKEKSDVLQNLKKNLDNERKQKTNAENDSKKLMKEIEQLQDKFDQTMKEKDEILRNLKDKVGNARAEQNDLEHKLKLDFQESQNAFEEKIEELEQRLDKVHLEKEEMLKRLICDSEKGKEEIADGLRREFEIVIAGKDAYIQDLQSSIEHLSNVLKEAQEDRENMEMELRKSLDAYDLLEKSFVEIKSENEDLSKRLDFEFQRFEKEMIEKDEAATLAIETLRAEKVNEIEQSTDKFNSVKEENISLEVCLAGKMEEIKGLADKLRMEKEQRETKELALNKEIYRLHEVVKKNDIELELQSSKANELRHLVKVNREKESLANEINTLKDNNVSEIDCVVDLNKGSDTAPELGNITEQLKSDHSKYEVEKLKQTLLDREEALRLVSNENKRLTVQLDSLANTVVLETSLMQTQSLPKNLTDVSDIQAVCTMTDASVDCADIENSKENELQAIIDALKIENDSLKCEMDAAKGESYKETVEASDEKAWHLNVAQKEMIKNLQEELKELYSTNEELKQKLDDLRDNLGADMTELERDLEATEQENLSLKEELEMVRESLKNSEKSKDEMSHILQSLRQDIYRALSDKTEKDHALHRLRIECDRLRKQIPTGGKPVPVILPLEIKQVSENSPLEESFETDYIQDIFHVSSEEPQRLSFRPEKEIALASSKEKKLLSSTNEKGVNTDGRQLTAESKLEEELAQVSAKKGESEKKLEQQLKINAKLKQMVKNLKTNVKDLKEGSQRLSREKRDNEQRCKELRTEMADLVKGKEDIINSFREKLDLLTDDKGKVVDDLKLEYNELLSQKDSDLKFYKGQLQTTQEQLETKISELESISSNLEDCVKAKGDLNDKYNNLDKINRQLKEHNEKLQERLNTVTEHARHVDMENSRLDQRNTDLEEITASFRKDIETFVRQGNQKVSHAVSDAITVRNDKVVSQLQEKNAELKEQLSDLTSKLLECEKESEFQRDNFQESKKSLLDEKNCISEEKQALEQDIQQLRQQVAKFEDNQGKETEFNNRAEDLIDQKNTAIFTLESENQILMTEKNKMSANMIQFDTKLNVLQEEKELLTKANLEMREKLTVSRKENEQIKETLKLQEQNLFLLNQEMEMLREEIKAFDSTKAAGDLQDKFDELSRNNTNLLQELGNAVKNRESNRTKLKKDYERISSALKMELEESKAQSLEREKTIQLLRLEVESVFLEKENLATLLRSLGKRAVSSPLKNEPDSHEGFASTLQEMKTELNRVTKECFKTRKEKDQLQTKLQKVSESLRGDLHKALEESIELSRQIDKMEEKNRKLTKSLREKESTIFQLKKNFEHIGKGWRSDLDQVRKERDDALGKITALEEQLKSPSVSDSTGSKNTIRTLEIENSKLIKNREDDEERFRFLSSRINELEVQKNVLEYELGNSKSLLNEAEEREKRIVDFQKPKRVPEKETILQLTELDIEPSVVSEPMNERLEEISRLYDAKCAAFENLVDQLKEERDIRKELEKRLTNTELQLCNQRAPPDRQFTIDMDGVDASLSTEQSQKLYQYSSSSIGRSAKSSVSYLKRLYRRSLKPRGLGKMAFASYVVVVHALALMFVFQVMAG